MSNNQNKSQFSQPSASDHQSKRKNLFISASQIVPSSQSLKTSQSEPIESYVSSRFHGRKNEQYSNYQSQIKNDGSQNDFNNQLLSNTKPNQQGNNQANTLVVGRKCTFDKGQYVAHTSQKNKTQTKNPQNVSPHITQRDQQQQIKDQGSQRKKQTDSKDIPWFDLKNTVYGFIEKIGVNKYIITSPRLSLPKIYPRARIKSRTKVTFKPLSNILPKIPR